jgi:tRNA A-37 threonylcarbamoyl transferase component Bud32
VTAPLSRLAGALSDRYRIERELGQGGMATVYLAHDLRHEREVAIKVLHPDLGAALGGERFLSEIKTTARLQHPHILPLLDSGEADGLLYYVMPYVRGETLRTRLERERQLPIDSALQIAREVADALGAAHALGIIHRDIKPENILLQGGHALVADFGIALAVQQAGGARMTQTGLSLGTPQYMSPEQAMGERTIEARSDIYALGAVTYEMLTGDPPFTGSSVQAIVARVLSERPTPLRTLRDTVPVHVEQVVLTALAKLPADRFATAAEFSAALTGGRFATLRSGTQTAAPGGTAVEAGSRRNGWKWAAGALALAAVGAIGLAAWALGRSDSKPHDIGLPPTAPIQMANLFRNFSVAADGSFIAYQSRSGATTQLWIKPLNGEEPYPVPGTEGVSGTPWLSPDGKRVAFVSAGDLKVATIGGGRIVTVARVKDPLGGGWLPDGKLFFGDEDGRVLRWVDPETGPGRSIEVAYCIQPHMIEGDGRILCGGGAEKYASVLSLERPEGRHPLDRSPGRAESGSPFLLGSHFQIVDGSYLVYMSIDGALMGTRIEDAESLTVGRSVSLVPGVRRNAYSGVGQYHISDGGTLVYVPGINADVGRLVRLTGEGRQVPIPVAPAAYLRFTPSPDGRRLATVIEGIQQQELTVYDLGTGTSETVDKAFFIGSPSWSPGSSSLVYRRMEGPRSESLVLRRLDSRDPPLELFSRTPPVALQASSFLSGDSLLVGAGSKARGIFIVNSGATPPTVDSVAVNTFFVSLSPDRRWLAYQNVGTSGVHLQPWPALDRHYLVDAEGTEPRWKSATELVYLVHTTWSSSTGSSIYRRRIDPSSGSPVGQRDLVIQDLRFIDTPGWSHAVAGNGDQIYLQAPAEQLGYYLRVVPGWVKQMKRAVDAANR